ncbi:3-oxoacyl-[acyl-carrier-protein] reductase [Curtanaerobium respiraculi]|uniref:3-oxoacyl-[acyl-carrier-protein] reductase n=1 Tax=Curtanaerobium respiraculi TaxID=2949669 RepID=UPI0024B3B166|nr:3-oxoacyl-[acyl-carrier-protein] reductase [Curtanaerobium respiraculi]
MTTPITRAALVTGSSRGIGRAVARTLAASGCNVCVNCSSEHSLPSARQIADELAREFGVAAIARVGDVADARQAKELVAACVEGFGRIDILVNNAGITRDGLIMRMKEADFDDVIAVNLKGAFTCCQAAIRPMAKQRYGRIVNMSSVVGVYGNAGQVNYAASKAGVIGITKALAREVASRGITVNAVAPGFIASDMTAALTDAQREAIAARIGCGRLGEVDDVAHTVGFLASENAGYITGQVLCVDGGLSL